MSQKFEVIPKKCIYGAENFQIYACTVDSEAYPNIKLNKYNNVTICGDCGELLLGMLYHVDAKEEKGKYGYSYKIKHIKQEKPMSTSGVREFLIACGLSQNQSDEIMREYPNIIDLVQANKVDEIDISKLHNIGDYRINVIIKKIQANFMLSDIVEALGGYFSLSIIRKLFENFQSTDKIIEALKSNPYQCLCGINRVGFKTADSILLELETNIKEALAKGDKPPFVFFEDLRTSKNRCLSALNWILDENEINGNTTMNIVKAGKELKQLVPECSHYYKDICIQSVGDPIDTLNPFVVQKKDKSISKTRTYLKEIACAYSVTTAINNPCKWDIDVSRYKNNGDISLTDEQLNTLQIVCDNQISILSGFAGSGKSASTLSLIKMLEENHKSFVLLAPTGRASKVLSEYTKKYASTIDRLLIFNSNKELNSDIVIVDESSMMDITLFYNLLSIINFQRTKLLLIGDPAQLPSVGAGNVLFDLINSKKVAVNSLTKIFRYGDNSILTVATDIRNSSSYLNKQLGDSSYVFIETPQEKMIKKLKALYQKLLQNGYKTEDILILSSYNKGIYGTVAINNLLQPIVNPNVNDKNKHIIIKSSKEKDAQEIKFCLNDIVIQVKNNYKAVMCDKFGNIQYQGEEPKKTFIPNGEIGKIVVMKSSDYIIINFNDEYVLYNIEDMYHVKLAYSISTHKSQGGSAKIVIMLTPKAHTYMLNSNLLYVAVTRAKERVIHFGTQSTVNMAIKKKADIVRQTCLINLIVEFCNNADEYNNININKIKKEKYLNERQ